MADTADKKFDLSIMHYNGESKLTYCLQFENNIQFLMTKYYMYELHNHEINKAYGLSKYQSYSLI